MPGIPIRQFLGIAPYLDKRDLSENYAAEARNITFKRSYCKSEYLKATLEPSTFGGEVLYYGIVTLASDPLMNFISNNKLVPSNYYNTEDFLLVIEKINQNNYAYLAVNLFQGSYYREESLLGEYSIPIENDLSVNVVEDQEMVKIFIKDNTTNQGYAFQMSMSSRYLYMFEVDENGNYNYSNTRFTGPNMEPHPSWNDDPKGIYINRLMESYDKSHLGLGPDGTLLGDSKLGIDFNVNIVSQNIPTDIKTVYFTNHNHRTVVYKNRIYPLIEWEILDTMDTEDTSDDENIERFEPDWDWDGQFDKYEHWAYIQFRENQEYNYILVPKNYFDATGLYPVNDNGIRLDITYPILNNPHGLVIHENGEHTLIYLGGEYFEIPIGDLENKHWRIAADYIGGTAGVGFETQYNKIELAATLILDRRDEYVVCRKRMLLGSSGDKFALLIKNLKIPFNTINKRITGWALYLRFSDTEDFQQVKFVDLLSTYEKYDKFYIHSLSPNGIFLKQTIGTLYNYDNHRRLGYVDNYKRIAGVNYALANGKIYGPVSANGQLIDVYYEENVIPNVCNDKIIHIADLNNTLSVHTKNYMKILVAQDGGDGILLYFVKDGLQLGIKNKYDVVQLADGIFINSKDGLHFTNGETHIEVGAEIKNIIEEKFSTSKIFYNEITKQLFLITKNTDTTIYIYSTIDKTWNSYDTNFYTGEIPFTDIEELFFDNEGNTFLSTLTGNLKLFKYEFKTEGMASISYSFDFKQLPGWKIISGILIDYKGTVRYYNPETHTIDDYVSYINPVTNEIERATRIFYYDLDSRTPNRYIEFSLPIKNDTTIYNFDVQIDQVAEDDI